MLILKIIKLSSWLSKKWGHLCNSITIFNYNTMSNGTVKFFNESKGFGFITEEGVDRDHFVYISGLVDEIREGDSVEFNLQEGKKGLNAVNVKVI